MAIEKMTYKVLGNVKLNNGTKDGKTVTVDLPIGGFNIASYDDQKFMNIVDLLGPCLDKNVYSVEKIEYSKLVKDV